MHKIVIAAVVMVMAACGAAGPSEDALDPGKLPAELMGLVPGTSTEAQVIAALPGKEVVRDQSFGGDRYVELSGVPAVSVRDPDDNFERTAQAWLVKLDGELRLASLRVPIKRACGEVLQDFGDRVKKGYCRFSNRVLDRGEMQMCGTAAGGQKIWIECHDGKRIELWLEWKRGSSRSYRIAPLSAGRERDHE